MKLNKLFFVQIFGEFCAASMWMQLHCYGSDPLVAHGGVLSYGLCDGCALMIIIQTFGCVSGAYFNPCLTIAAVIMGQLKWDLAIIYVIMQYLGTMLGLVLAFYTTPAMTRSDLYCVSDLAPQTTIMGGCFLEFLMTSAWVLAQCTCWDKRAQGIQESISLRMGFVMVSLVLCAGYMTGLSMNPAKSLAGALFNWYWTNNWIYHVAPLLAAILMPLVHRFLLNEGSKSAEE
ncbi:lens fiber major intrinsic protein-like [Zeugodacus cucurbitae]|uniref:lens fiber major intrinsic protein-like n=1 Tax=Zeugodacus cucurbitae TaxID=28588 RepID=UPI0005969030|nr:lens fiber major intrinsic protein-like [Zeugodacus cucurbitae]